MEQIKKPTSSLKEPVFHGDILFPYTFHHCEIPDNFQDLLAHWHEEAEITIIREGQSIYHIASTSYHVNTGDLLILSPNILHSINEIRGCNMISDTLVFHMNLLGINTPDNCSLKYFIPIQNNIYTIVPIIHPKDDGYKELLSCMEEIILCVSKQGIAGSEILLKERLFHLFFLLYQYHYVNTSSALSLSEVRDEKIKQALSFLEKKYREQIRISALASLCGFSEVHFMNLFKKAVGVSCIEYLNLIRLNQSAVKLKNSSDTVLNIAMDCGFINISYFNRQFRTHFNMTPLEYRKRM